LLLNDTAVSITQIAVMIGRGGNIVDYITLPYDKMITFCEEIFTSYGFTNEQSHVITDVLLRADLYGIESHGVQRLVRYDREIGRGMVSIHAVPKVIHETPVSAVIDADRAMGQLSGVHGMQLAIKKAHKNGIGMIQVCNSNHFGIAGYYAKMAVEEDMIGICMTNTEAIMLPTFGKQPMLGTDPISLAMPADPIPFLFDAATTVVPRGKLEVYNKTERPLPDGWVLDEDGTGSNDPKRVLYNIIHRIGGGILPLGGEGELHSGYKGYGLALICELCTGILSGGPTANHISSSGSYSGISHCFWAVDYGIFGGKKEIRSRFSDYLREIRNSPKATGEDRIFIHGEKELEEEQRKKKIGIPVNKKTFQEMQKIAKEQHVDINDYFDASSITDIETI